MGFRMSLSRSHYPKFQIVRVSVIQGNEKYERRNDYDAIVWFSGYLYILTAVVFSISSSCMFSSGSGFHYVMKLIKV